jgi:hypothetical protein
MANVLSVLLPHAAPCSGTDPRVEPDDSLYWTGSSWRCRRCGTAGMHTGGS